MKILGVKIDNLSKKEILAKIEFFLNEDKFHQIATVNPEFILQAQKDLEFGKILNSTDLNVADGIGIWYAFIRNFKYLKARMTGVDLMYEVLKIANDKKLGVYLAINKNGLSSFEEICKKIREEYPKLEISGEEMDPSNESYKIQNTKYDVLFCNFGAPYQEKFINLQKNATIKLALGVGGAFDFLTKKRKRAPEILQFLGLEWVWRFMLEPRYRARRIFRATIIFPIKVILKKTS